MFDLQAFRRDLHQNPETGFETVRTAKRIASVLKDAGLKVFENIGKTGVVAILQRGADEDAIGLRADMDALPITEANTFDYRSTNAGRFHGCGHDGHSTMLLGAALKLAQDPGLKRTIHFIFQPDEENGNGARAMIRDGLFDRFPMKAIYGMHNLPGLETGHFATQIGPFLAFEDNFEIRVNGKGGHAAKPEMGIDAIVTGAAIVTQLQTIVSRSISAARHVVVSVTGFETDGARNILASNVLISGDCRGFTGEDSSQIEQRIREIVKGVALAQGASAEVSYSTSFRPLVNDVEQTRIAIKAAELVGPVDGECGRVGFAEDFAEFLQHRPGNFINIGNGLEGANAMPLHNPGYDFNDALIPHGIAYWEELARQGQQ